MRLFIALVSVCLISCQNKGENLSGTYRLLESTTIKGNDTTFAKVDSTKTEMIKILNGTHFSFFNHDVAKGVDSTAFYMSGAGRYTFENNSYIENLDFCTYRPYEGRQFKFSMTIKGDTLIQEGVEDIPELGVKQFIVEKYVKIK